MNKPLYNHIASAIDARKRCSENGNNEWFSRWEDKLDDIERYHLPSGSGIDSGCKLDINVNNTDKITIHSSYHVMNENGYYDGWIDFRVVVKPSLIHEIELNIIGQFGKNQDIKDYLGDIFYTALTESIEL